jgi:hypothetical protein
MPSEYPTVPLVDSELVQALAVAQGEFSSIEKGKVADAGKYKYAYADLADVLAAVVPALSKHGLAILQRPGVTVSDDGLQIVEVETILAHTSGASVAMNLKLPVGSIEMQSVGSAITYLRRYSLLSLLGVAPAGEDDDGAAARQKPRERRPVVAKGPALITEAQVQKVWNTAGAKARESVGADDVDDHSKVIVRTALAAIGEVSTKEVPRDKVDAVLRSIEEHVS